MKLLSLILAASLCPIVLTLGLNTAKALPPKEIATILDELAASIKKGDEKTTAELADKLNDNIEYLEDVMNFLRPRKKGGFGVGPDRSAIYPDGIERKLLIVGRDTLAEATLNTEAKAYEEMAYRTAAIAEVTKYWYRKRARFNKVRKGYWLHIRQMKEASVALAQEAGSKNPRPEVIHKLAHEVNQSCVWCHNVYRFGCPITLPRKR